MLNGDSLERHCRLNLQAPHIHLRTQAGRAYAHIVSHPHRMQGSSPLSTTGTQRYHHTPGVSHGTETYRAFSPRSPACQSCHHELQCSLPPYIITRLAPFPAACQKSKSLAGMLVSPLMCMHFIKCMSINRLGRMSMRYDGLVVALMCMHCAASMSD